MGYGSVIKSSGDKISDDTRLSVFVQGAYNQGAVIEIKEILTAVMHPGETAQYPTGAGGEDNIVLSADESISPVGLVEIDFAQISLTSTDYAVADEVPTILYHWNPGALCRNVQCADQVGDVADAGKLLSTSSGVAGSLKILTEVALVDPAGAGTGEAYNSGVTWGDMGTLHHNRTPMRSYSYQADASAAYTCVAYILNT